jgi:hypothetical protein
MMKDTECSVVRMDSLTWLYFFEIGSKSLLGRLRGYGFSFICYRIEDFKDGKK